MSKPDGGPAFPESVRSTDLDGRPIAIIKNGMTLRDYFAIHANEDDIESAMLPGEPLDNPEWRAIARYRYADAMLKEREK